MTFPSARSDARDDTRARLLIAGALVLATLGGSSLLAQCAGHNENADPHHGGRRLYPLARSARTG